MAVLTGLQTGEDRLVVGDDLVELGLLGDGELAVQVIADDGAVPVIEGIEPVPQSFQICLACDLLTDSRVQPGANLDRLAGERVVEVYDDCGADGVLVEARRLLGAAVANCSVVIADRPCDVAVSQSDVGQCATGSGIVQGSPRDESLPGVTGQSLQLAVANQDARGLSRLQAGGEFCQRIRRWMPSCQGSDDLRDDGAIGVSDVDF